jgi:hypothetical protein
MEERRHTDQAILSEIAVLGGSVADLKECTGELKADMRNLKENHLAHIERDVAQVSNDLDWLKKFFWLIAGGLIANFAASLAKIL